MNQTDKNLTERLFNQWAFVTSGEISEHLGIPQRKVLHYVELGIIRPVDSSPGRGNSRKFTPFDLMAFCLFFQLDQLGVAPRRLSKMSNEINSIMKSFVTSETIAPMPNFIEAYVQRDGKVSIDATNRPDSTRPVSIVLNLTTLRDHIVTEFEEKWLAR